MKEHTTTGRLLQEHGFRTKKRLGQNFLCDPKITQKIACSGGDLTNSVVLEVGAGPGSLTRSLLQAGTKHVIAIEKDRECLPLLQVLQQEYPERLSIQQGDILELPLQDILSKLSMAPSNLKIIANLPYYISSELLVNWLGIDQWPPLWQSLTLLFQKEFAERLVAKPNSKAYGRLSVLAQWRSHCRILFHIRPGSFKPPPKVTSTLVQITPKTDYLSCDNILLQQLTQACFSKRRKMLSNSLKTICDNPAELLTAIGIDGYKRADQITPTEYIMLCQKLSEYLKKKTEI